MIHQEVSRNSVSRKLCVPLHLVRHEVDQTAFHRWQREQAYSPSKESERRKHLVERLVHDACKRATKAETRVLLYWCMELNGKMIRGGDGTVSYMAAVLGMSQRTVRRALLKWSEDPTTGKALTYRRFR